MVPENMQGAVLYPLNQLKEIHPDIYTEELKKYANRKQLPERKIPILDCLWNDVIHLTAVHPKKVKAALQEGGANPPRNKWFKINPIDLDASNLLVYLYQNRTREFARRNDLDNYTEFHISNLSKYNSIQEDTINYYKREVREGRKPFIFHLVPHILYKGSIDIRQCEVIQV